jgi:hypothetical protein
MNDLKSHIQFDTMQNISGILKLQQSEILIEKLIVAQLIKKSPLFMKHGC